MGSRTRILRGSVLPRGRKACYIVPQRLHVFVLHNCDHDLLADDPGREARRDVLNVAFALCEALRGQKLSVSEVGVRDLFDASDALRARRPDAVVNLCESLAADSRGEMALPCLLELLEVPYTGSPPLALGLALHKDKAKEILLARGVPTPPFRLVARVSDLVDLPLPFPLIVKPSREDASV